MKTSITILILDKVKKSKGNFKIHSKMKVILGNI